MDLDKGDDRGARMQEAAFRCCKHNCEATLTPEELESTRVAVWSMPYKKQKQWLHMVFACGYDHSSHTFVHTVSGKQVCLAAWLRATNVKKSRYYEARKRFLQGVYEDRSPMKTRFIVASELAIQWLERFAEKNGDKLLNADKILLPSSMTKSMVFSEYSDEFRDTGYSVARSTFLHHWKTLCSHITIPEQSCFSRCTLCDLYAKKIPAEKQKDKKDALVTSCNGHLDRVRKERCKYYKHCTKSKKEPNKYLTLIIDGMDQQKTCVPHFTTNSKANSNKQKLKVHIVGALTHGHGAYIFMEYGQFSDDSNLTNTVLLHCLVEVASKQQIPPVLYLQMDNASGQNKNKFVLAMIGYLVQVGVFRKVKLSFLPVGHTHEDVDQMFSRISTYLNRHDALTPSDLRDAITASYTPTPQVCEVQEVYNVKDWISGHIEEIHGHTQPHHFRFQLVDGELQVAFKQWSDDKEWVVTEPSLLVDPHTIPMQCPLVTPSPDVGMLQRLLYDVQHLPEYISPDQLVEWEHFTERLLKNNRSQRPVSMPPQALKTRSQVTTRPREISSSSTTRELLDPDIQRLVERENMRPEVVIGRVKGNTKRKRKKDKSAGAPKRKRRQTCQEEEEHKLKLGELVAILPEKSQFTGDPWIGKCTGVDQQERSLSLQWMKGGYSKAWTEDKEYTEETISFDSILLSGFKLDKSATVLEPLSVVQSLVEMVSDGSANFLNWYLDNNSEQAFFDESAYMQQ